MHRVASAVRHAPRPLAARRLVALFALGAAGAATVGRPVGAVEVSFTDGTLAAGITAVHQPSALMEAGLFVLGAFCGGGVVGDFDNDGFEDIFFIGGGVQPDILYINNGDGTFTNRAAEWGVAVHHMGMAAAAGDYDNDGWLDIFVTSGGPHGATPAAGKHRLYRNTGMGSFVEVAAQAGVQKVSPVVCDGMGAAFGDYDRDGDLDLFVTGWLPFSQGNRLFRNNGDGTFTDVTIAAGLTPGGIRGFTPRFADMDDDGWPDLLIAADFGTSRYFRNHGDGTFTNLTASAGTGIDDNGMGHAVGDLDNDGRLDWYVSSIWSLGNPESPGTGNMLYWNQGRNLFVEGSVAAGVNNGGWGWGTAVADLDHDGWLDLLETNGWVSYLEFTNAPSRVWINQGDGTFVDRAAVSGLWHTLFGRGLLTADFDNDGDQDVLIFSNKGPLRLYRNNVAADGSARWLRIRLDTAGSRRLAPAGIHSRITVLTEKQTLVREIDAGSNYQSQSELTAHFGLGHAEFVDVRIRAADGTSRLLRNVQTNQTLVVDLGERSDLDGDGRVDAGDIGLLLGSWGGCDPADPRDLNADGAIDATDLMILLFNWTD
ncbi:MAG TPA: FG-GAP-like repeat-containing protein [Phycisphaerales bacterium]|nr:FG-GAP-like repeat-containing protein [Phycisphaerales bacterium]HMP37191.1 FG-GAP-like repeat-containing protein [Phycisphaerales bacterium]